MIGRLTQPGPETSEYGTRCDAHKTIAQVNVFPHGSCDVRSAFRALAAQIPELAIKADGPIKNTWSGAETHAQILPVNPWSLTSAVRPSGAATGLVGRTDVWVEYWHWKPTTSFFQALFAPTSDARRGKGKAYLEVSCLTWTYDLQPGQDCETSLVFDLHRFFDPLDEYHLEQSAERLATELQELLRQRVPSEEAVRSRQLLTARELAAGEARTQWQLANSQRLKAREEQRILEQERQRLEEEERRRRMAEEAARRAEEEKRREEERQRNASQRWQEGIERHRQEQREREAAQRREAASRLLRTVAILYDSSYLMSEARAKPLLHDVWSWLQRASLTNIVAAEVGIEIGRHLEDGDRHSKKKASRARGRVLELKESRLPFQEVQLSAVVRDPGRDQDPLGADSPTDRLLIEYACHLVVSAMFRVVVIATNDGGIRQTVMVRRQKIRLPVYAIADPWMIAQVRPVEDVVLAISAPKSEF